MTSFTFTPRDEVLLGWDAVRQALSALASSAAGKRYTQAPPFYDTIDAAHASMCRVTEAQRAQVEGDPLSVGEVPEVTGLIARADRGAALECHELVAVAQVADACVQLRRWVAHAHSTRPQLWAKMAALPDLSPLAAILWGAVGRDGALLDDASTELMQARQRVRRLSEALRARMDELLVDPAVAPLLMDNFVSVRHGRYVLPIQACFAAKIPGIVHNASHTGQTLFIEPEQVVAMGNELTVAHAAEQTAALKARLVLSGEVKDTAVDLLAAMTGLAELDWIQACGQLTEQLSLNSPRLVAATEPLRLPSLFHPRLALSMHRPVASDVLLDEHTLGLVISGPNAGGKTVVLASIALAITMARAGLPIATAPGARLPWYTGLSCSWGDGQSLAHGLSSFAAQLAALCEMTHRAQPGQIVIIDELGGDTDPSEGAALARAILEHLTARGVLACVSTHLDQMRALALTNRRFVNARMGYTQDNLRPSYRLELGLAGHSFALRLAEQAGMNPDILACARGYVGGSGQLAEALERLEASQASLVRAEQALQQDRAQLAQDRAAAAQTAIDARAQARAETQMHAAEHRQQLESTAKELRQLVISLRSEQDLPRTHRAQSALRKKIDSLATQPPASTSGSKQAPGDGFRVGQWVRVHPLGHTGQLQSVDKTSGQATVLAGAMRSRVKLESLELVGSQPHFSHKKGSAPKNVMHQRPYDVAPQAPATPAGRCDVRGLRSDEALRLLGRALDACLSEGTGTLLVVHGHGSGALRAEIRQYAQGSPYVAHWRTGQAEEGGEGVTVILLDRA